MAPKPVAALGGGAMVGMLGGLIGPNGSLLDTAPHAALLPL